MSSINQNKWTLTIKSSYSLSDGQIIVRDHMIAIPPTSGDRTDVIDTDGRYHYDMSREEFTKRLPKDEYLDQCLPGLPEKDRVKALKEIDWTPKKRDEGIELIIEIKKGNITLKGK